MRRHHFELVRPVCPLCRHQGRGDLSLVLEEVFEEAEDDVGEGILRCPHPTCRHEYPILDGIPMIVPRLRELVAGWIDRIRARDAFAAPLESLLGDCCGPGSAYDDERQRLSSYVWDHWGEFDDPSERGPLDEDRPGAVARIVQAGLDAAAADGWTPPAGPVLDIGCAVGRTTLELAARLGRPTLGIDLDISMLRYARRFRDSGIVTYPRRRIGLVYDRRRFPITDADTNGAWQAIDFWCCDATALPWSDDSFALVASLNVLDCMGVPLTALQEIARSLAPRGRALLALPYDWSPAATPLEHWIGGHSQRHANAGAGDELLRQLLTPGAHPASLDGVRIVAERPGLPWHVRLHERSTVRYRCDMIAIERSADGISG